MAANKQARQKAVLEALRRGNTRRAACAAAGVHNDTIYDWMRDSAFSEAVKKAEAEAEIDDIEIIRQAAINGAWQAAAWRCERRNPADWGKKELDLTKLSTKQIYDLWQLIHGGPGEGTPEATPTPTPSAGT